LTFFPTLTRELLEENLPWLRPNYIDPASGQLLLCIQSYIVRTPHHNILIDSCVGNHKPRANYPFWDGMTSDRYEKNLAATGLTVDDIDFVMCTHMHVDHVGWNTRLENGRWVPTFPKAKYVFADRELAFWTEKERADPGKQPWIVDSVLPIIQAGRQEVVSSHHQLSDTVTLIPTPGHTIDHYSVRVGKPGADAVIGGDMIHSPLQARYPDLAMRADYDRAQGGASRRALFGALCDTPTLLCTGHFPSPSKGRLTAWGDGFRYNPA
jgi:glyoxylase-like metal-dependent hydrolase (beta-lactamase superfamily II)